MAEDQTPAVVEKAIATQTVVTPDWPRDVHGFTSGFRREVARTVGRIRGNDEKFELFIAHLRTAAEWARHRHGVGKAIKAQTIEQNEALRAAAEAKAASGIVAVEQETDEAKADAQANAGVGGAAVNGAAGKPAAKGKGK